MLFLKGLGSAKLELLIQRIENPTSGSDLIFAQMELETLYFISGLGERSSIRTKMESLNPKTHSRLNEMYKAHWIELEYYFKNGEGNNSVIEVPAVAKLYNNYPNPFNPTTTINFAISEKSKVELAIYNIKGQRVITLKSEVLEAGKHSVIWNGQDNSRKRVSSGVYFYRLYSGKKTFFKKMLLLK